MTHDVFFHGILIGLVHHFDIHKTVIAEGFYPRGRRNTHHDTREQAEAAIKADAEAFFAKVIRAAVSAP